MKKLLVLVVVLAMVACANAGIVNNLGGALYGFVEVSEGVVNIVALQTAAPAVQFMIGSNDGVIVLGTVGAKGTDPQGNPTFFEVDELGNPGTSGTFASEYVGSIATYSAWVANDVVFAGNTLSKGSMKLFSLVVDENENVLLTEMASYSVPEPITVALLGLGGLFIRRKVA